jgi:subtilase family serine protease
MQRVAIAAAVAVAGTVVATAVSVPANAAAASSHVVPNTKPSWTAHAKRLGSASNAGAVTARVYLAPRGGVAAEQAAATAISTPGSASYHKFLTATQFQAKYGVTAATVKSVTSYLKSAGFTVSAPAAANRYVTVRGTVAKANKAFGTTIDKYVHNGATVQAPAKSLTLPASLGASVLTVTGLDTTPSTVAPASTPQAAPPAGFRNAAPCSQYYGQVKATYQADYKTKLPTFDGKTLSYAPCGYTGPQLRAAYEGDTTLTGKGVTVGILDAYASPSMAKDANTYATRHGDGSYLPGQYVETKAAKFTHQAACGPSGWYGEESLDVEAVHAMAPDANIHYYGAASCEDADFLDSLAQIVSDDAVQIVSDSWGEVEEAESADAVAAYEQVFMQGALEGISFMFSSGDNGDELATSGLVQADYPTSDPYVTSVGGTSTAIGADGSITFQAGWGTDKYSLSADGTSWTAAGYLYGAGGGSSSLFNKPAYQDGIVPGARRQVPDVAMDADPNTGMLIGEKQTFPDGTYYDEYRIGGTSLASPLFAGETALALQSAGSSAGLLNPYLYQNASKFTDIKGTPKQAGDVRVDYVNSVDATGGLTYSVRTFGDDSSLAVKKGWDPVTGLGVPNPAFLASVGS